MTYLLFEEDHYGHGDFARYVARFTGVTEKDMDEIVKAEGYGYYWTEDDFPEYTSKEDWFNSNK